MRRVNFEDFLGGLCLFLFAFGISSTVLEENAIAQTETWKSLTGAWSGNGREVAASPNGDVFAGSQSGLWISTDSGETWGLTSIRSDVYCVSTDSNGIVYAALFNSPPGGRTLFRSTDRGETFTQINDNPAQGCAILKIIALPSGSLLAGTDGAGLFRSTDAGTTWTPAGLSWLTVRDVRVASSGYIYAGTDSGIYRTLDTGKTWGNIGLTHRSVYSVLNLGSGPILAGTDSGIYRSTDGGLSWEQCGSDTDSYASIVADDSSKRVIAGTNHGILVSTDEGASWMPQIIGWWPATYPDPIISLAVGPNGYIFASTESDGVFRSTDDGTTWSKVALSSEVIRSIAIDTSGNIFYAGEPAGPVATSGVFRSTDLGRTWKCLGQPGISQDVWALEIDPQGHIFAGSNGGGIYRSTDDGDSWKWMADLKSDVLSFAVDSRGTIFAGTDGNGIWCTSDDGGNWAQTGLTSLSVLCLTVNHVGSILAGTNKGIYASTDGGITWSQCLLESVSAIWTAPSGTLFASGSTIFRSTNNGNTWVTINSAPALVSSFASNSTGTVYIGSYRTGVYESTDDGDSWIESNDGLADLWIASLAVGPSGQVYAGGQAGDLYATENSTSSLRKLAKGIPKVFELYQNYPNPFNPSTTIVYDLPRRSQVVLAVYDVLGRNVRILVNGEKPAGSYRVTFDASSLPSGVYFCRLLAGGFVRTKKLMLVK